MTREASERLAAEPGLIEPYGGALVNLIAPDDGGELLAHAAGLPRLQLTARGVCDLELLATGGFSPLDRFMGRADYERVLDEMRLADGTLFPIPVTLPVAEGRGRPARRGGRALPTRQRPSRGDARRGDLRVGRRREARAGLRHRRPAPPARRRDELVGPTPTSPGGCASSTPPRHYDFSDLRLTPARRARASVGARPSQRRRLPDAQPAAPRPRGADQRAPRRRVDGALLLHPVVGMTKPGDVDHYTRVRTYKALAERLLRPGADRCSRCCRWRCAWPGRARRCGTRSSGATTARTTSSSAATTPAPATTRTGSPFYGPYDAQELVERHAAEMGVSAAAFQRAGLPPGRGPLRGG